MDVSVIIVNYNTLEVTRNCINSIYDHTEGINFEVILVDNSSSDGSKEIFEVDSRLTYIYLDNNVGFGRANNIGLSKASGDYVLFLNSDTLLLNNAIKIMHEEICTRKQMKIGTLGCMLSGIDGNTIHSYGDFFTIKSLINNALKAYTKNPFRRTRYIPQGIEVKDDFFRVDYVTGADAMVPMSVIKKIGAFDLSFFMYCEDCYMQYVYTQHGYSSYISIKPQIMHLESVSTNRSNASHNLKKKILIERSRFIYIKKTSLKWQYKFFRILYFILRFPFILKPTLNFSEKKRYFSMLISSVRL